MFFEFSHGGHALAKGAKEAGVARGRRDIVTPEQAGEDFDPDAMTPFRYLIEKVGVDDLLPVSPTTVATLDKLGEAIITQPPSGGVDGQDADPDASFPPVFTYWSQFIDHELTARTDRNTLLGDITVDSAELTPVDRATVERDLLNRRTPALELDCLYGDRLKGRRGFPGPFGFGRPGGPRPGFPGHPGSPGSHGHHHDHADERRIQLARKMRDGAKMRIGTAEVVNQGPTIPGPQPGDPRVPNPSAGQPAGPVPPPATDLNRDLPRIGALLAAGVVKEEDFPEDLRKSGTFRQRAFIGDPRNDENLVVAQFHLALLRFHNAVVDWLQFKDPREERRDTEALFEDARQIVRWTFQWLTVNQFLKTLLRADVVDHVVKERAPLYRREMEDPKRPYMPVEFSAACYRFGHSMIRNVYDYNRNFGRKEGEPGQPDGGRGFVLANSTLNLLFQFTGKARTPFDPSGGRAVPPPQVLPHNWIIEWDRFDGTSPHDASDEQPARLARKIDTHLAPRLGKMENEVKDPTATDRISLLLQHLARRNLRRGYQLSLPTGQAVARAVSAGSLNQEELGRGNSALMNEAMNEGGFFERTPLWFYILKEAEVREDGQRLGEVGSRVVAETFIGVLLADPESYLAQKPDWDPSQPTPEAGGPLRLPDGRTISTISDLFRFAGVAA